jgi:hypothetical protein
MTTRSSMTWPTAAEILPDDAESATLVGRAWVPAVSGPSVVVLRGPEVVDVSAVFPTMRALTESVDPAAAATAAAAASGTLIGTIHELSLAPTAGADDPQFWSDYTRALHMTGEHEKELKTARRAVSLMPERRGVRAFVAWALIALDSGEAAIGVINEAVAMPAELDASTGSVVSGLSTAISELRAHGNLKLVPELEERLRGEISDAITGGKPPFALHLQIASALLNLGDDSAARAIAIELRRTDTLRFELAGIIGVASARLGDTTQAEREMQRLSETGNRLRPYSLGFDLMSRARVAAALGRESQAVSLAARSIAEGNGYNVRRAAHTEREFQALMRNRNFQKLLGARGE